MRPRAERRRADKRHRANAECDRPRIVRPEQVAGDRRGAVDGLVRPELRETSRIGPEAVDPTALRLDVRRPDQRVELARHDVQRPAQESRLDDGSRGQRAGQLLLREPVQPRPERDVRRRRVLRLKRDEAPDGAPHGHTPAVEQHLTEEERAVQVAQRQRRRHDRGLEEVARRVCEQRGQPVQADLVGDEALPRIRPAREEREGGAHRPGGVVEGASDGELVVVEAVGVERRPRVARQAAEEEHRPAGADEIDGCPPRLLGPHGLDHDVGAPALRRPRRRTPRRAPAARGGRRPRPAARRRRQRRSRA